MGNLFYDEPKLRTHKIRSQTDVKVGDVVRFNSPGFEGSWNGRMGRVTAIREVNGMDYGIGAGPGLAHILSVDNYLCEPWPTGSKCEWGGWQCEVIDG